MLYSVMLAFLKDQRDHIYIYIYRICVYRYIGGLICTSNYEVGRRDRSVSAVRGKVI